MSHPDSLADPELYITRRRLPHWTLEGAMYFVTCRLLRGDLDAREIRAVLDHLRAGDPQYYELLAATVMPDHSHLLLRPAKAVSLARIMKGVKGVSARQLNQLRGTVGSIWQDESFDRIMRDEAELQEKLRYMLHNPVKAGLAEDGWSYPGFYCKVSLE